MWYEYLYRKGVGLQESACCVFLVGQKVCRAREEPCMQAHSGPCSSYAG